MAAIDASKESRRLPPPGADAGERPAKRARCNPPHDEETLEDRYAAMLAERDRLFHTPTFDERYAALLASRSKVADDPPSNINEQHKQHKQHKRGIYEPPPCDREEYLWTPVDSPVFWH